MPKISVIVPVYNTEPYLRQCIDSILNQTFTDFELLLVDDGSTDHSGEICEEYAQIDARIKLFHTPNHGVSAARNLGINQASGEWITFVDSDDWVEEEYLSCFLQKELVPKTIVYQNFIFDYTTYDGGIRVAFLYDDISFDSSNIIQAISKYRILSDAFVTAKLFYCEIIKQCNIHFNEQVSICEDMIFVRNYLHYVENVYLCSSASYHYMQRDSYISLMRSYHSSEEYILAFEELQNSLMYLLNKYPICDALYTKQLYTLHGLIHLIAACKEVNRKNYRAVFEYVRLQKDLFEKYYISVSLGSRIFQKVLFHRLLPNNMIFFLLWFGKTINAGTIKFFKE